MTVVTHLHIVGWLLLALAGLNLLVPWRFAWREELARLSLLNRQIFQVHAGFIVLILVLFATLVLTCARPLLDPHPVSRAVLAGLAAFWFVRLLVQWLYYDRRLWRGHRFNTMMHYAFTALWTYFTAAFAYALWASLRNQ